MYFLLKKDKEKKTKKRHTHTGQSLLLVIRLYPLEKVELSSKLYNEIRIFLHKSFFYDSRSISVTTYLR